MGLAVLDVSRRNELGGEWQSSCANAHLGQRSRAGGDDGPLRCRQGLQQCQCTRSGHHTFEVFNFASFHNAVFRLVIGLR
jgi:hypothetical protein